MEFGDWDLSFEFRVQGSANRVEGLGVRVSGSGFRVWGAVGFTA